MKIDPEEKTDVDPMELARINDRNAKWAVAIALVCMAIVVTIAFIKLGVI